MSASPDRLVTKNFLVFILEKIKPNNESQVQINQIKLLHVFKGFAYFTYFDIAHLLYIVKLRNITYCSKLIHEKFLNIYLLQKITLYYTVRPFLTIFIVCFWSYK